MGFIPLWCGPTSLKLCEVQWSQSKSNSGGDISAKFFMSCTVQLGDCRINTYSHLIPFCHNKCINSCCNLHTQVAHYQILQTARNCGELVNCETPPIAAYYHTSRKILTKIFTQCGMSLSLKNDFKSSLSSVDTICSVNVVLKHYG